MNTNVKNEVIDLLKKYAINKKIFDHLPENPNIVNDLKINSARLVDIVIDVEEKFNIEIENEELKKLIYLNDIITLIEHKVKH